MPLNVTHFKALIDGEDKSGRQGYESTYIMHHRALVRTGATGAWHPLLFVAWVPRVPDFSSFS